MSEPTTTDVWAELNKRHAAQRRALIRIEEKARGKREVDRLDAENIGLRFDLNDMRRHLREALISLKQPKCDECEGSGGVEMFDGPTPMDEVVLGWTDPEDESCDCCMGTGRDLV